MNIFVSGDRIVFNEKASDFAGMNAIVVEEHRDLVGEEAEPMYECVYNLDGTFTVGKDCTSIDIFRASEMDHFS